MLKVVKTKNEDKITIGDAIDKGYRIAYIYDNMPYAFATQTLNTTNGYPETTKKKIYVADVESRINAGLDVLAFKTTKEMYQYFIDTLT